VTQLSAREQILKAADSLFGEVGFDAATTREIAELSGVNKALIHYHFKSKEALLEALLDDYYERLNTILLAELRKEGSLREKMKRIVDVYVDFLSRNLNFSRIVQRESAGGGQMGRIRKHLVPIFQPGIELIEEAYPETRSGDLAAPHLLVSFYGMIVSYFTFSGVLERLIGKDPLSKNEIKQRKRHLYRMVEIVVASLEEAAVPDGDRRGRKRQGGKP